MGDPHARARSGDVLNRSRQGRSNVDVMRAILEAMGQLADAFDWLCERPGHDRRYAVDSTKLRTELGWCPQHTDFMAGLQEAIAWCCDNESWWTAAKDAVEERCAECE